MRWLVTGGAGFIGSHLVEALLGRGDAVVVLDDMSSGKPANLDAVASAVGAEAWSGFSLIEDDIRDAPVVAQAVDGVDYVLHHAARGSVPESLEDPELYHAVNIDGTFNVFEAARRSEVRGVVFASSAAVYGDDPGQPKQEDRIGVPLSPYALGKRVGEQYAALMAEAYELPIVCLRYFNVVGPRQDPAGQYAAVVPKWLECLAAGQRPVVYGDGETSRDFCPVADVVQANVLAATSAAKHRGKVFNVGLGRQTSLDELFAILRDGMSARGAPCSGIEPVYEDFRPGDIRHSCADISRARNELGFSPTESVAEGLGPAIEAWARS